MQSVHKMPFGAHIQNDGYVRFRLWAPAVKKAELILENGTGKSNTLRMQAHADGWFQVLADPSQAASGTLYYYRLDDTLNAPDPASRSNPQDVHGPSQLVDPNDFDWQDNDWKGLSWHEALIYELHIGAFTAEGTFTAAMKRLDHLVELGVTAIQIMPLADFPGTRNWGYDGVLLFAPDSSYGAPEQLKALIQAAHLRGLMVFLDVVYNHFGPDGNYLYSYAPQFFNRRKHTAWGAAINFDGEYSRIVRDFFIHNALYWLEEYHFDGLRLDAVHALFDNSQLHIVEELAAAIQAGPGQDRQVHLVLENAGNSARYLQHETISAQWNDDIHHAVHQLLTDERHGYYIDYADHPTRHLARCLAEGFAYQGEPSPFHNRRRRGEPSAHLPPAVFINFSQTHDQVGNRAFGERLSMLSRPEQLQVALAVLLLAPSPPMLFMGEEFAAATPFHFFCDFHADLAEAVSKGRRREFFDFAKMSDQDLCLCIPEPNDPATFERSKLEWDCLNEAHHNRWFEYYQNLFSIRHRYLAPRLNDMRGGATFELIGSSGLNVIWSLSDGGRLLLLANLGEMPVEGEFTITGTAFFLSQVDLMESLAMQRIPPWSAAWFID